MKKIFSRSFSSEDSEKDVNKTKFIQSRIKLVEKYISELDKALFEYTDKTAKCRDSGDKVATVLDNYAKAENVTVDIKQHLIDFADILLEVGTNRDAQVQDLENKVLEQLGEYNKLTKIVQADLKHSLIASDKERIWNRQLKRMRENHPENQMQISATETEFLRARGESFRSSKSLEEQIDIFEKKRLYALREALLAWTTTELQFHSKALQLYTDAYRIAADIDVNVDIEEFRNRLRSTEPTPRSDSMQRSESILQLISAPFQRKADYSTSGIPHPPSETTSSRSSSTSMS